MKLKAFCPFDSNSFQNAQNLLFQAEICLQFESGSFQNAQNLLFQAEKANFERFESYSNQRDKRL